MARRVRETHRCGWVVKRTAVKIRAVRFTHPTKLCPEYDTLSATVARLSAPAMSADVAR